MAWHRVTGPLPTQPSRHVSDILGVYVVQTHMRIHSPAHTTQTHACSSSCCCAGTWRPGPEPVTTRSDARSPGTRRSGKARAPSEFAIPAWTLPPPKNMRRISLGRAARTDGSESEGEPEAQKDIQKQYANRRTLLSTEEAAIPALLKSETATSACSRLTCLRSR